MNQILSYDHSCIFRRSFHIGLSADRLGDGFGKPLRVSCFGVVSDCDFHVNPLIPLFLFCGFRYFFMIEVIAHYWRLTEGRTVLVIITDIKHALYFRSANLINQLFFD